MPLMSSTQPSLRARVLPRFPANVVAGDGIAIARSGNTYTFSAGAGIGGQVHYDIVQTLTQSQKAQARSNIGVKEVNLSQFGAVGDGLANDTVALRAFWQSAIDNPGIVHRMGVGRFMTTLPMPVINVANVKIYGAGCEMHDAYAVLQGSVLVFNAASSGLTFVEVASIPGALNARIANIDIVGIGLDCNSLIGYGLVIRSVQECVFRVAVADALSIGILTTCVATLAPAEPRDTQRNILDLQSRQWSPAGGQNGFGLVMSGVADGSANSSWNDVWFEGIHKNVSCIKLEATDNNRFHHIVSHHYGTASESVSCSPGGNPGFRCRAEKFFYVSTSLPMHFYGGNAGETYPSDFCEIYCLDKENITPNPVVDPPGAFAGAYVYIHPTAGYYDPTAGGVGYAPGMGVTATQAAGSRLNGVTANTLTGAIQLCMAVGSNVPAKFVVTNNKIKVDDLIVLSQRTGLDIYHLHIWKVIDGSFTIAAYTTGGTTNEAPIINFAVIKGASF